MEYEYRRGIQTVRYIVIEYPSYIELRNKLFRRGEINIDIKKVIGEDTI